MAFSLTDTLASLVRVQNWSMSILVLLLTSLAAFLIHYSRPPRFPPNAPYLFTKGKGQWPIIGALRFFHHRANFVQEGMHASPNGAFSFYWGKLRIVNIPSTVEGRRFFFDTPDKQLSFSKGYGVLFGGGPRVIDDDKGTPLDFVPALRELMQKKNFTRLLPTLVGDVQTRLTSILATQGEAGMIDPFVDLYEIVYQLTMRTVGATEIAESPAQLKKTLRLFEAIESNVSHIKHVFPWLPTVKQYKRMFYGAQLYMTIAKIVDERKKTGTRYEDCAQMLIDQGHETLPILGFILSALFAGQLNSGINAGWAMIQLGDNPEWRAKLHEEVDTVIAAHRTSPDQTPLEVLQTLDVDAWESEFPLIDLILRESIRMSLPGTAMRYNQSGTDLPIGKTGEVVPKDGFAVFWVQALHSDPSIYPEPSKFDPGRYLPDRAEDKKVPHGYMGWGMGRHPCQGMRFAKLEMAIITACFAALFDWTTVDVNGKPFDKLPMMDANIYAASKPKEQMRLKYTLRAAKG